MMGHRTKRFRLFAETNLEALVPPDNCYRLLESYQCVSDRRGGTDNGAADGPRTNPAP